MKQIISLNLSLKKFELMSKEKKLSLKKTTLKATNKNMLASNMENSIKQPTNTAATRIENQNVFGTYFYHEQCYFINNLGSTIFVVFILFGFINFFKKTIKPFGSHQMVEIEFFNFFVNGIIFFTSCSNIIINSIFYFRNINCRTTKFYTSNLGANLVLRNFLKLKKLHRNLFWIYYQLQLQFFYYQHLHKRHYLSLFLLMMLKQLNLKKHKKRN